MTLEWPADPRTQATSGREGRGSSPLRIAMIHSFYSSRDPSGENRVVEAEVRALRAAGHEVKLVAARTDELEGEPLYRVRSAIRVATGIGRSPLPSLAGFEPQVVHVHNLFPNWSSRWPGSLDVPLVTTLHNFRPICANGALFRAGKVCTRCLDEGDPLPSLRYACYRGSRLATAPVAAADRRGIGGHPVIACAARVIVLSERAREIYERAGLVPSRLVTWPNFLSADDDPGSIADPGRGRHWLYVGRLGPEKGIARLVRSWPRDRRLVIAGEGPDMATVRADAVGKPVELLGLRSRSSIRELMRDAIGLVFPSVCYENFPLVYAESMAAGLPVLAWEPNAVSDLVRTSGTGMTTTWHADLGATLERATDTFPGLATRCREVFEAELTEHAYVQRAERLYGDVIEGFDPSDRALRGGVETAARRSSGGATRDRAHTASNSE
jgi:glycosyltransferase involved in cell wall biosynthesis